MLVPCLRHAIVSIPLLAPLAAVAFLLFACFATVALVQLSAIRIAGVSFLLLPRIAELRAIRTLDQTRFFSFRIPKPNVRTIP